MILRKLDKALMTVNLFGAYIVRKSRQPNVKRPPIVSIHLPNQNESLNRVGLDIGGSLIKLIYFVPNEPKNSKKIGNSAIQDKQHRGGTLHFVKFEVNNIDQCINFLKHNNLHRHKTYRVTGGGAHKYAEYFNKVLGVQFEKVDEMQSLITGLNYFLKNIQGESFTYSNKTGLPVMIDSVIEDPFPYLLVNIGSGVSILRVDSENKYERVGGTSLGGGTFWGLCHLLTGEVDFDAMLELSEKGDARNVDLLVGDIYGQEYSKIGLTSETIASSFGKLLSKKKTSNIKYSKADIAMSLLRMISNNIGQIAYLHAMKYNLERIYFGGFFLRNHRPTVEKISFAISYWSKEKIQAHFLHHEGYLGGFGALMLDSNSSFYEKSIAYINKKLQRSDA